MRKTLITLFAVLVSLVMLSGVSYATVSGVCSSCHTMHDSQANAQEGTTGTQDNLLLYSCLACHTSGGSALAPKIDGTAATTGIGSGTSMTAGGDVDLGGTQSTRHDIGSADAYAMLPPGYTTGLTWTSQQVTCDGTYGCHGTHTANEGVNGKHHGSDSAYRWLYVQAGNTGGAGTAVLGQESTTWEAGGATTTNHNVYSSHATQGISSFCANCHGNFHGTANTNASSPFKRHPTDASAPIVNVDNATFTPTSAELDETPFAFPVVSAMVTTDMTTGVAYTSANGVVMCLSCHRAHGTAQNDILRFTYANMYAGGDGPDSGSVTNDGGCETCHYDQR